MAFDETIFEEITGQPKSVQLGSGNMMSRLGGLDAEPLTSLKQ